MTSPQLTERDRAEIRRSAQEARKIVLKPADVERYLNPPADTAYALEYAFHLLGDARGKKVLDLGCGMGENIVALAKRGAHVMGMDISPELIALAQQRINNAEVEAALKVGSAYETGLPDESLDLILCIALIHHLDIPVVRDEMRRILARNGAIILSEPIRFSVVYKFLRNLFRPPEDVSDHEHPLTRDELATFTGHFKTEGIRYFRVPLLPLMDRALPSSIVARTRPWEMDRWILHNCKAAERYATNITMRLRTAS
jgi:ubiquinone/menaquinone biosynthesis C-methylase UbiE